MNRDLYIIESLHQDSEIMSGLFHCISKFHHLTHSYVFYVYKIDDFNLN
jgi:hypothetical protein